MTKIMFSLKPKCEVEVKRTTRNTSMFWAKSKIDSDTKNIYDVLSRLNLFEVVESEDTQQKRSGKMSYFCNNMTPKEFQRNIEAILTDRFRYNCSEVKTQ